MKINEALNIKTQNRIKLMEIAQGKRDELHCVIPRVKQIDAIITSMPLRMLSGENKDTLKAETEQLQRERAKLLESAGYPADYDEPKFECTVCNDSGYCEGFKVCQCIRVMTASDNYTQSNLAKGLQGKTFDNFSLSYYPEGEIRNAMQSVFEGCKRYAETFGDDDAAGLLFFGGTGLGKTHLSAAIASTVASKGVSVVYESAQQIFDTCESVRFNKGDISEKKKYEDCQLLIIDDLGAEYNNEYNKSYITSLIDSRIVNGKKTIISTNLNSSQIRKNYSERLFSRLLGEFRVLKFLGNDIRMQKINEKR